LRHPQASTNCWTVPAPIINNDFTARVRREAAKGWARTTRTSARRGLAAGLLLS
jgi:hypothetical protein